MTYFRDGSDHTMSAPTIRELKEALVAPWDRMFIEGTYVHCFSGLGHVPSYLPGERPDREKNARNWAVSYMEYSSVLEDAANRAGPRLWDVLDEAATLISVPMKYLASRIPDVVEKALFLYADQGNLTLQTAYLLLEEHHADVLTELAQVVKKAEYRKNVLDGLARGYDGDLEALTILGFPLATEALLPRYRDFFGSVCQVGDPHLFDIAVSDSDRALDTLSSASLDTEERAVLIDLVRASSAPAPLDYYLARVRGVDDEYARAVAGI